MALNETVMIPKIIHFVWVGSDMPEWVKYNIAEFQRLNPNHEIKIHGEDVLPPSFRDIYDSIVGLCQKSDLLRCCALREGGWYFDTDFFPFRPVEDIERAYGLDGSQLFLTRQAGNSNPDNSIANGMMAIESNSPIIEDILDRIRHAPVRSGVAIGPALMKKYVHDFPSNCVLASPEWFFPANYHDAVMHFERIRNGYADVAKTMHTGTGGQLPFAMHLWAGGKTELSIHKRVSDTEVDIINPDGRNIAGMILNKVQAKRYYEHPDFPMKRAAMGLAALGYRVEVKTDNVSWPCFSRKPEKVVIWNGMREPLLQFIDNACREGIPVYRIEHGWFDRKNYHQCDQRGILHWSSLVQKFHLPAPAEFRARLRQVLGRPLIPVTLNRRSNTILVLGQISGDTQMFESEINGPLQIDKAVCRAIEGLDVHAEFRPHPLDRAYEVRKKYLPASRHSSLEEAVRACRFVVTINSNAGVEALAFGRPVLCFGPATYAQAGVAMQTTLKDLRANIQRMEHFTVDQSQVENYLSWLAGAQFSLDEFAAGVPFMDGRVA
jgi:hypothetical protein